MKTVKRNRPEHRLDLAEYVGRSEAWGTELGAVVFSKINLVLIGLSEGALVLLDYGGLERSDASFQREAVVETLRKHRPRVLFIALNLTDSDVAANLELALEKRGDCLLLRTDRGGPSVIGRRLTAEQAETLKVVRAKGSVTSSDLSGDDLNLSTASSRLAGLWKAGLIERVEGTSPSGGREHRYYGVE